MTDEIKVELIKNVRMLAKGFSDLEELLQKGFIERFEVAGSLIMAIGAIKLMVIEIYPEGHEGYADDCQSHSKNSQSIN